jgi:hypothetical protein
MNTAEKFGPLARPFRPDQLGWKAQATSKDGSKALAVAYIDARDVMDRLDEVVGIDGWRDAYTLLPDGSVVCRLELRFYEEWVGKEDVGGPSDQPDAGDRQKSAFSDALKRAAVKWGVGRYLYALPAVWVPYDAQRKQLKETPPLPAWALPPAASRRDAPTPVPPTRAASPLEKMKAHDAKLAAAGVCKPGDLLAAIGESCVKAGHGADTSKWGEPAWAHARAAAARFAADRGPATKEELAALEKELDRTGETVERLVAKLGAAKGTTCTQLTSAQARWAVGTLAELADAQKA